MTFAAEKTADSLDIAVVGMSGRFPGARTVKEFWENLKNGVESISRLSDAELLEAGMNPELLQDPNYVKAVPALTDIDQFDAQFFGYNAREAAMLDPQQRVFLECAWEALEGAGYDPKRYTGLIGVFAGANLPTYLIANLLAGRHLHADAQGFELLTSNDKDYLATRVGYKLDLKGPCLSVQSACSTSLVAVHLACQALLNYECDMALAGGVSIRVPHKAGYKYQEGLIFSPDGHCRPFDADARGTVFGSGAGAVVLKRLSEALADGDPIEAVIKATAVNNDGAWKIGYTAPSIEGQMRVISTALGLASINPETIGAIEAHGTGTPVGDPIEITALTRAYRAHTQKTGYCAISAVKSNIGHLDTAAGIAGLIKAILQLKHKQLVPSLHYQAPNPQIDFGSTPFHVNTTLRDFPANGETPRRAGVSSFGIGGTNAHVILEEPPEQEPSAGGKSWNLLVVSGKSPGALDAATSNLAAYLEQHPESSLADVAYTLQNGRQPFRHRRMLVGQNAEDAARALSGADPQRVLSGASAEERPIAFMFPGQGAQYPNMARELYRTEPSFQQHVDDCARILQPHLGFDLREVLFPADQSHLERAAERLTATSVTQPALFVIEYALAKLLEEWGVQPQAMIGHSIGEYVAACLGGVFSLEEALRLVAVRGRLMEEMPAGTMLSVVLSEADLLPLLTPMLSLAAVNGPALCVVAGPEEAVAELEEQLAAKEVACRRLHTSHAFHSRMMEPILARFKDEVRKVRLNAPNRRYISNVTGTWITAGESTDPEYWALHLRQTVRFSDGINTLVAGSPCILLEVGPGQTLSTLARQCLGVRSESVALSTVKHPQDLQSDVAFLLTAVGRLWLAGAKIEWAGLHKGEVRYRLPLPTYPFQRQRYWIEPKVTRTDVAEIGFDQTGPGEEAAAALQADFGTHHARPSLPTAYVAPESDDQRVIAEVWQDFLGVAPIGNHDNFFELGGHSLLATQILGRISDKLGVKIPLRHLLEKPTVAGLAAALNETRGGEKQAADEAALPIAVIAPESLHEPFPLTEMQQAQWIGRLGGFNVSNIAAHVYLEVEGEQIDLPRLNQAWQRVIERHPMLRAVILSDGRQQILQEIPQYRIEAMDLTAADATPVTQQLDEIRERMSHEVRPADRWPLFEVRATRLPGGRVRVHISWDLLIADIASLRIVFRDWRKYYQGQEQLMEPLEITFRDYVISEEAMREHPLYAKSLEYWRDRVKTLPPAPELPLAKAPEAVTQPHFTRRWKRLSRVKWTRLKQYAQRHGVTPSAVLMAAYASTLATWSKRANFTLNVTVINRLPIHPQVKKVVGEFGSFALMEVNAGEAVPFVEMVRQVQARNWEDLEHRYVHGVRVLRELARVRGGTSGAVMPVVITSTLVQELEPGEESMFDWLGETVFQVSQTPQVWLDHAVLEEHGQLELSWVAIDELFPAGMVDDMFSAYARFVEELSESDERWTQSTYEWLPAEQREVRTAVNDTAGDVANDLLHTALAVQAAIRAEQPALITEARTLNFRELFRRANALGRKLRELGVRPNSLVAVAVEKSWEQIVAVLGVLSAGAAYLPLDPELPADRQEYVLEHGLVEIAITRDGAPIAPTWPALIHVLPAVQDGWEGPEGEPLSPVQGPDDLAYVLYTSGSTGQPKGVMISHRAALNTILDINTRFGVKPGDAVLALSALSFDLSVYDIFGMLSAGGTIILPEAEASRNPVRWLELMRSHRVTLWNSVPALMEMLAEQALAEQSREPLALRLALLSGDWIPVTLPERVKQLGDGVQVISLGGATEAGIWSIYFPIEHVDPAWESIPYGKPLRNQWWTVLNERFEPCPDWVHGHLYIGGAGLAKGYWQDQEKTAASFISHPMTGERLYRTGDLGRYLPDGSIEFLGREDLQVKIRGYRIEIGEIEAALAQHPSVRAAVVVAVGADRHHRRLVAYIVPRAEGSERCAVGDQQLLGEIRTHLENTLPPYMMPASIGLLDSLPLTANGKVDRNALARLERSGGNEAPQHDLTADPIATKLAALVAEVLGVEKVGPYDNFFEIGGDSIIAIQIINRVNAVGLEVTPQMIFEHQTIAALAQAIRNNSHKPIDVTGQVPLTPFQQRLLNAVSGDSSHAIRRLILDLSEVDQALVEQALQQLLQHHDALRLSFVREGDGWAQTFLENVESAYVPVIDLSTLSPADQTVAVDQMIAEMEGEIRSSHGPLLNMAMFELGTSSRRLVWITHRLLVDDHSWSILVEDFFTAYGQLSHGEAVLLPPCRTSFKEWANRLQQWNETNAADTAESWLALGATQVRPLAAASQAAGGRLDQFVQAVLDEEETGALLEQVPASYRLSLMETVLAAVARALEPLTGGGELLVDVEQQARTFFSDLDLSRTVGCFTSAFPVLLETSAQALGDALNQVKEQYRTVASSGLSYDFLRFNAAPAPGAALKGLPQPEIAVTELGNLDWHLPDSAPITVRKPSHGPVRGSGERTPYLLNLVFFTGNNQFHARWEFNSTALDPTAVEQLASRFIGELRAIIAYCQSAEGVALIPSDFPHADLTQTQLESLLASFEEDSEQ